MLYIVNESTVFDVVLKEHIISLSVMLSQACWVFTLTKDTPPTEAGCDRRNAERCWYERYLVDLDGVFGFSPMRIAAVRPAVSSEST